MAALIRALSSSGKSYTSRMIFRFTLLVAILVSGCSDTVSEKPRKTRKDRQEAAEAALSKTPVPRIYRIDGDELKVIDVPVKDPSGFLEIHRCFVWKDRELKTSTLSCGQQPEVLISN